MADTTPQVQLLKNSLLTPDMLSQSSQAVDPNAAVVQQMQDQQNTQNALRMFQQGRSQGGSVGVGGGQLSAAQAAYAGLCQKFVEDQTYGHSGIFPTAIAAFQAQKHNARGDFQNMKPGDLIYFAPDQSNGNAGHTGIYQGNGQMVSATYNGVQRSDLDNWIKSTGQTPIGYIPTRK